MRIIFVSGDEAVASKHARVFDEVTPHHHYLGPFIIGDRETTLGSLPAGWVAVFKFIDESVGRDPLARDRVHQRLPPSVSNCHE
jgi:hypothetical protein